MTQIRIAAAFVLRGLGAWAVKKADMLDPPPPVSTDSNGGAGPVLPPKQ